MNRVPTVTDAKVWSPDSLQRAADGWQGAAVEVQTQVDGVVRGVDATVDFWTGSAAERVRDESGRITAKLLLVAESLFTASEIARDGVERMSQARAAVLTLVEKAYHYGCNVADDGTVTPPTILPAEILEQVGSIDLARRLMAGYATQVSADIAAALVALGDTDAEVAAQLDEAFAAPATPTAAAGSDDWTVPPADIVAAWPTLSQHRIAAQLAGLTPEQRQRLIEDFPQQVGNTDGVPWDMRMAANRLNITNAIVEQENLLRMSDEEKIVALVREEFPNWSPGDTTMNPAPSHIYATLMASESSRREAVARFDEQPNQRITFYRDMLGKVTDPTGQTSELVDRQIIAFDPGRSSFVELSGNLETADHIGVFVPGVNTTVLSSGSNLETTRRIVEAGRGDIAMLTYVGGPFPDCSTKPEWVNAADNSYATDMAPRLVAFSEDVNRVADSMGRDVSVTVIGHSYGGSVLGTAESMGLTADRTLYIAAAGAGVGVTEESDWHNRNPDVVRYAMTAPGDWIEMLQGANYGYGPHGADVDEMDGVIRLQTGEYADGRLLAGWDAHSEIVNEPSEAYDNMLAVITGDDVTTYDAVSVAPPLPSIHPFAGLPFDPTELWPINLPTISIPR